MISAKGFDRVVRIILNIVCPVSHAALHLRFKGWKARAFNTTNGAVNWREGSQSTKHKHIANHG